MSEQVALFQSENTPPHTSSADAEKTLEEFGTGVRTEPEDRFIEQKSLDAKSYLASFRMTSLS
jgi:hypothetical protein